MGEALALAALCPTSDEAFAVGAVIVDADGAELSRGHSRETDAEVHAEEAALAKLVAGEPRLAGATLYSTLEPCTRRKSRPLTCTDLILRAGIVRVVIAWREPAVFVAGGEGVERLRAAGVTVDELPDLADAARAPNVHLLRRS